MAEKGDLYKWEFEMNLGTWYPSGIGAFYAASGLSYLNKDPILTEVDEKRQRALIWVVVEDTALFDEAREKELLEKRYQSVRSWDYELISFELDKEKSEEAKKVREAMTSTSKEDGDPKPSPIEAQTPVLGYPPAEPAKPTAKIGAPMDAPTIGQKPPTDPGKPEAPTGRAIPEAQPTAQSGPAPPRT